MRLVLSHEKLRGMVFQLRVLLRIIVIRAAVVVIEVIGVSAEVGPLFIRTRTSSSAQINCKRSVLEVLPPKSGDCEGHISIYCRTISYETSRYHQRNL